MSSIVSSNRLSFCLYPIDDGDDVSAWITTWFTLDAHQIENLALDSTFLFQFSKHCIPWVFAF